MDSNDDGKTCCSLLLQVGILKLEENFSGFEEKVSA